MSGTYFNIIERIDDRDVQRTIRRIIDKADRPVAFFKNVGEYLVRSVKDRFDSQTAPDGTAWTPLKPATKMRKRIDKILTETSGLKDSFIYAANNGGVRAGTNKIYGAVHQFGLKGPVKIPAHKSRRTTVFGRKLSFPVWAEVREHTIEQNIPARPILGLSTEDRQEIPQIAADFLMGR